MRRELISHIEGERILDFGVGTGYTTRTFPHAVGIDLSMKMLQKAVDYQGQLVCADLLSAPFKGGCFDTVVSAGSFYYLPDPVKGLQIIHGLLKNRGVALFLTPNSRLPVLKPFIHVYTHKDFETLFHDTGFIPEMVETTSARGYVCFCKARKEAG
jgi:SAM-dependent methyltransferase